MSQGEMVKEKVFSFSHFKETVSSAISGQFEKIEQKGRIFISALSVNNYLKTAEEIEDDFLTERFALLPDQLRNNRDGYLNIQNPERIDSGFMEENY